MSSEIYFPKSLLTYCFKYFIDSGKDVRLCSLFSATRDGWLSSTSNTGWWSSCMLLECGQCGLDTRRKTLGTDKMGSGHKEENVRSRDNQTQTMLQNERWQGWEKYLTGRPLRSNPPCCQDSPSSVVLGHRQLERGGCGPQGRLEGSAMGEEPSVQSLSFPGEPSVQHSSLPFPGETGQRPCAHDVQEQQGAPRLVSLEERSAGRILRRRGSSTDQ